MARKKKEQARDARDRFVKDKAEGFEKAKLDDALKFKELGVALEVISLATGLSAEEIEGL